MLIYDPTYDPYHCALRILAILSNSTRSVWEIELVQIANYFLVYPSKVSDIRLPTQYRAIRKNSKSLSSPYRNPIGIKASYERTRPVFQAAVAALAANGYIDTDHLKGGTLVPRNDAIPEKLKIAVENFLNRNSEVKKFIIEDLVSIPLTGADGLKHRSHLAEYRYDIV